MGSLEGKRPYSPSANEIRGRRFEENIFPTQQRLADNWDSFEASDIIRGIQWTRQQGCDRNTGSSSNSSSDFPSIIWGLSCWKQSRLEIPRTERRVSSLQDSWKEFETPETQMAWYELLWFYLTSLSLGQSVGCQDGTDESWFVGDLEEIRELIKVLSQHLTWLRKTTKYQSV
jgi:hypothetical protein